PYVLYSFPTRRSSDLYTFIGESKCSNFNSFISLPSPEYKYTLSPTSMSPAATQPFPITQNGWVGVVSISSSSTNILTITLVSFRSEEHTSELQSRENL